jgi:hypothetical protein
LLSLLEAIPFAGVVVCTCCRHLVYLSRSPPSPESTCRHGGCLNFAVVYRDLTMIDFLWRP